MRCFLWEFPLWLVFSHPLNDEPMGRMMMTLDTGAAIKGALRGDIFWGTGDDALEVAGRTKTTASFFCLVASCRNDWRMCHES